MKKSEIKNMWHLTGIIMILIMIYALVFHGETVKECLTNFFMRQFERGF
ncbi:MAG: hypothetical protein OSJ43_17100 [Oscillospiraceae bacterium]|nr:hypothetical protein [Oscillospiraceae bacterium]